MEKPKQTLNPIGSYYLAIFLIVACIFALIVHLALVVEINFFTNLRNDALLVFGIVLFLLLFPNKIKIKLGEKFIPILKYIVTFYGKAGNYEQFENAVYKNRELRLEQDNKIKANPKMYFLMVMTIILVLIGIVFLMYYSATGNF